ncbi:hypothetical protein LVJ94_47810 [Pendulispora rubella]|uniref:Ketosynthase family 3 (KS3) domain-containing protein n=1 Tax=Pendulispora rubella TaxID=2741070 RepID=A0ABZ2L3M9_9BACT
MNKHDVVITGIGLATPLGHDAESVWGRLVDSKSAVRTLEPLGQGGSAVEDFDPVEHVKQRKILRMTNRATVFSLAAARRAWADAGLEGSTAYEPTRFGIYTGSGESEMRPEAFLPGLTHAIDERGHLDIGAFARTGLDNVDPYVALTSLSNNALCYISVAHQLMGPNSNYVKSAVASSQALGEAAWIVRHGYADAIMVVGVDSLSDPLAVVAYNSLGLLCKDTERVGSAMRPFDRARSGFMPGEGAGAVILESAEGARRRGARVHGRVLGFGQATYVVDVFEGVSDGTGLTTAIGDALADANLAADRVDFIVADGSASVHGDASEAKGIARVAGGALRTTPLTATKPLSGHLGAATGVVESIFGLLMMQHGQVPPIHNLDDPAVDPSLGFVTEQPLKGRFHAGLHIARGLGGQNAVLVLGRA